VYKLYGTFIRIFRKYREYFEEVNSVWLDTMLDEDAVPKSSQHDLPSYNHYIRNQDVCSVSD